MQLPKWPPSPNVQERQPTCHQNPWENHQCTPINWIALLMESWLFKSWHVSFPNPAQPHILSMTHDLPLVRYQCQSSNLNVANSTLIVSIQPTPSSQFPYDVPLTTRTTAHQLSSYATSWLHWRKLLSMSGACKDPRGGPLVNKRTNVSSWCWNKQLVTSNSKTV